MLNMLVISLFWTVEDGEDSWLQILDYDIVLIEVLVRIMLQENIGVLLFGRRTFFFGLEALTWNASPIKL